MKLTETGKTAFVLELETYHNVTNSHALPLSLWERFSMPIRALAVNYQTEQTVDKYIVVFGVRIPLILVDPKGFEPSTS